MTAVLGGLGTPVGQLATDVIDLSFADEHSVVRTRFPTTLITLLRAHRGLSTPELAVLAAAARRALSEPVVELQPRQLVVLGCGWAAPLAQEAGPEVP